MTPHVHTHHHTGSADNGDKAGTIHSAPTGLAGGGGRPYSLGIGLGGDYAKHERKASANIFQRSAGHDVAIAAVYAFGVGDAIKVGHHGVCINGLDAGHNAPESVPKVQYHSSGGQRGDIEQQQLDDTSGTGTADTAKKYKKHDEHRTDNCRPREGNTEKTGDHCRGGKHLRHNADKYADKE